MKIFPILCSLAVFALAAGCGQGSGPTGPDATVPEGVVLSALGYRVKVFDYQGPATQAHADLADQYWEQLMTDLQGAGYSEEQADPENIRGGYLYIYLKQSRTPTGDILHSDGSTIVGGYYSRQAGAFYVPGDYPTAQWPGRPNSQPLKHEYLHHWCYSVLKQDCLAPGRTWSDKDSHVWPTPKGQNIWSYTWY